MWAGPVTSVGPGTVSTSYSGNRNFQSSGFGTTVFNSSVNFNSWKRLNFETKTWVQANINFPSGKGEVGFYGNNKAKYVTMNDSDIIYAEGVMEFDEIISNNSRPGQWNMIFTSDRVKIAGKYYKPRDTFFSTPGNPETAVLITDCYGVSLPLTILSFSGKVMNNHIEVRWEVAEKTPIKLHYSSNGENWKVLSENAQSPYTISDISEMNFVKISSIDNYYSPTISFKIEGANKEGIIKYYDLMGRELQEEPIGIPYTILHISPTGITTEKKFIIH